MTGDARVWGRVSGRAAARREKNCGLALQTVLRECRL
jgi:hypothetical protein